MVIFRPTAGLPEIFFTTVDRKTLSLFSALIASQPHADYCKAKKSRFRFIASLVSFNCKMNDGRCALLSFSCLSRRDATDSEIQDARYAIALPHALVMSHMNL